MITTYAVLTGIRPDLAQAVLAETLSEEGVTDFEVALMSVVAGGYTFAITAAETKGNLVTLTRLTGEINVKQTRESREEKAPVTERLERKIARQPAFELTGPDEGRFARERGAREPEK